MAGRSGSRETTRPAEAVAVKRVHIWTTTQRTRAQREALALRSLRVPGVVTLRDEGEDDSGTYLIMDYIEGTPFPGTTGPMPWSELVPIARQLLETLAAVHAAGIVHRDLKPQNVLVTPQGRPVILDFGIARGQPLGETVTRSHHLVGTPRYLAPEALFSARVDGRADLYALGVMLWEALAGSGPYPDDAPIGAKIAPPDPLQQVAPQVPPEAAALIDALVDPKPGRRPPSASHVLQRLHEGQTLPELPLLARDRLLDEVVDQVHSGAQVRILAVPGGGATRFLDALETRLAPTAVHRAQPATRPFASLTPVLGVPDGSDLEGTRARLAARLTELDGVVIVDGLDRIDRWSQRLIEGRSPVVITTTILPADFELEPLTATELRGLFLGPERLLRVPTRAAEVLWSRTQGLPALVADEIQSWVHSRRCAWEGSRLRLASGALAGLQQGLTSATRRQPRSHLEPDLDALLATIWLAQPVATTERLAVAAQRTPWECEALLLELQRGGLTVEGPEGWIPQAMSLQLQRWSSDELAARHSVLADTHAIGSTHRCRHLCLAGRTEEAARQARALAESALAHGRTHDALAVLSTLMPALDTAPARTAVLCAWADLALGQRTPDLVDRASTALRPHTTEPGVRAWWTLLRARERTDAGDPQAARALLSELDARRDPRPDATFERWRATLQMEATKDDPDEAERVLAQYVDRPALAPRLDHWRGLLAYRRGRFGDAARLHERSLEGAKGPLSRCSALFNMAAAWLADGDLQQAHDGASSLLDESATAELYRFAARAEWLLRSVAYARDAAGAPDLALVEAVDVLGLHSVAALVTLTEAAVAWRLDDPMCRALAAKARTHAAEAGMGPAALLATALDALCREDVAEATRCAEAAAVCPLPAIAVQVLGLVGPLAPAPGTDAAAAAFAAQCPAPTWDRRREVLSVREALARL